MIVSTRGSVIGLLAWQWKKVALFSVAAAITVVLHDLVGWEWLTLPAVPLAVAGGALGIFVSFRTNSAYDRWWEGRKLWGRMINTSRHIGTQAVAYLNGRPEAEQIVRRHIAYVHALRVLLRANKARPESAKGSAQSPFDDDGVMAYLTEAEKSSMRAETNLTHALLQAQLDTVTQMKHDGHIDSMQLHSFDETVRHLLDIQGGCERINKTPLPRGYGFVADQLMIAFGFLFPAVIVAQLSWAAIPINVLVCLAFALISESGRVLEDPFTEFWNGLPLSTISRMIERNLLQRVGVTDDLPPGWPQMNDSVLM